jgi:hypothetical protein
MAPEWVNPTGIGGKIERSRPLAAFVTGSGIPAVDTAQQAGRVASGKAPELTDRMGFAIGMTVSAGLLGSAIYYLLNGEAPRTPSRPDKSGLCRSVSHRVIRWRLLSDLHRILSQPRIPQHQ